MSIDGGSQKRARIGPAEVALPPAPTPSKARPRPLELPRTLWTSIAEWMHPRERNQLSLTCRGHRMNTMRKVDVADALRCQKVLHDIANTMISPGRPDLDAVAARIKAIIPENFLGTESAPRPRVGLLDPLLLPKQRWWACLMGVHDALTGLEVLPDHSEDQSDYTLEDHANFSPALLNSISSWKLVKILMGFFGPWAFDLATPELKNDKKCILEAAVHGEMVLKYVRPDILSDYLRDESFAHDLLKRVTLHSKQLPELATFTACQNERYEWSGRPAADTLASAALIAAITKRALSLPDLRDNSPLAWKQLKDLGFGTRTANRLLFSNLSLAERFDDWHNDDAIPRGNVIRCLAGVRKDPEWLADQVRHPDFYPKCIDYLSPRELNRKFWEGLFEHPFSYDCEMQDNTRGKFRDPEKGNFIVDEDFIVSRFVHYCLSSRAAHFSLCEDNDLPASMAFFDSEFRTLYPQPSFPTAAIILNVFFSLPNKEYQVNWLRTLIACKIDLDELRTELDRFPEITLWATYLQSNSPFSDKSTRDRIARILAAVLKSEEVMGTPGARESLLQDTILADHPNLTTLHSFARRLLGASTLWILPPLRSLTAPAAPPPVEDYPSPAAP